MEKTLPVLKNIYLDPGVEEELQNRLSRIEGHVRAGQGEKALRQLKRALAQVIKNL